MATKINKKPLKFVMCKRCGRKIPESRQSEYCSNKCKNDFATIRQLSGKLIKEIYGIVSNKGLFSDEEIGMKLRSDEFKEKFSQILFIQDENEGDNK